MFWLNQTNINKWCRTVNVQARWHDAHKIYANASLWVHLGPFTAWPVPQTATGSSDERVHIIQQGSAGSMTRTMTSPRILAATSTLSWPWTTCKVSSYRAVWRSAEERGQAQGPWQPASSHHEETTRESPSYADDRYSSQNICVGETDIEN